MKNKPKIWFDCDGVLLDWTRPFLEHSGIGAHYKYENIQHIDLSKLYENPEDFLTDMYNYHQSEVFSKLPPLLHAGYLQQLKLLGYELHVITQLENDVFARASRMENLMLAFGDVFTAVHFTVRGESKWNTIQLLDENANNGIIVLEDNPTFLEEASKNCIADDCIYAIQHPYNEIALCSIPYIMKCNNAIEAIEHIIKWKPHVK